MYTPPVDPLTEFFEGIRSPMTRDRYEKRIDLFFKHIEMPGSDLRERASAFARKAHEDAQWATYVINEYMRYQKERAERREISESTVPNYYKPIKLFCEMNDISLNWKKISRRFPQGKKFGHDRAPTLDEIKKILTYQDRRVKPVVLLMLSSGIRVGAFDYLDWGHIEKVERDGKVVAGRVKVYVDTSEEYQSFITPECYEELSEYMAYREANGERISEASPVIRDLFHPDKLGRGEPQSPKRLQSLGVKRLMEDALKATGVRGRLAEGKRRHEFQVDHGYRKFFKTTCERHMKSLHAEMLLNHSVGLADNYYRPAEEELLDDYLLAVPELTILKTVKPESQTIQDLRKRISELEDQGAVVKSLAKALEEMQCEIEELQRRKRST